MSQETIETFCPQSRAEWRAWLAKNHQSASAVWLVYYKSATNKPTLSWSDAVEEALCFGWIDSTKKTIDDERYKQYFSQRKPDSIWSKINKDKVADLIKNELMTNAGLESIKVAKENGSWTILDQVEALVIPEDLQTALDDYDGATTYFDELSKSKKKILLHWVTFAKRADTRQKRIKEIAKNARNNLLPKQFRT